ncbi:glutamate mutase [Nocardioides mangrovicus]|uniref:Glutamate mutase n=1 Tax=Nocardioides mangrovicus TaxID=2478913 RepID=A0A3L8P688_9ACTN|nr:glutamate mutase L [Nocardioides mangrovicus]RLV50741.1 glutamate mutase [Nocardioides mangrovicus]
MADRVVCVDVGSTWTKAALVDLDAAELVATAAHETTLATDVLDGVAGCRSALGDERSPVLVCSSAGGGLRIAVLGNEELVTAEAGRRVALSSGGKVVHVAALASGDDPMPALVESRPDVVLLVGGTDGGNAEVLLAGARALAGWAGPVVVAGNAEVRADVERLLAGVPHVVADNVMPRIGVLEPASARAAVRQVFLSHVIGGKELSRGDAFARLVRGATPDVVLAGIELLAAGAGVDVAVVDVGGATTDVHSVVRLDPEDASLGRDVVAPTPVTRTVEGDLGMRWSAVTTAEAGAAAGLCEADLLAAAQQRQDDPAWPGGDGADLALARAATVLAVRRHAGRSRVVVSPEGRVVERSGTDLREVDVLVGSGGVLRHAAPTDAQAVLGAATGTDPEGWQYPRSPRLVVDHDYVLAAVGLLAENHPSVALALGGRRLLEA